MKIQASSNKILEKIDVGLLPSTPHVAAAILELDDYVQPDCEQLGKFAAQCPVFTAELLSVVGRNAETTPSIEQMATRLGPSALRLLALTRATREKPAELGDPHWHRALTCAVAARELAETTSLADPEEAYIAGLLQNIGELVLLAYAPEEYGRLLDSVDEDVQRMLSEQQAFGVNHAELGADLIESWGLGSFLPDAIRHHHQPLEFLLDAHALVRVAHVAGGIATESGNRERAARAADQLVGLTRRDFDAIVRRTSRRVAELEGEREKLRGSNTDWAGPVEARVRDLALIEIANPLEPAGRDSLLAHLAYAATWLIGSRRTAFFEARSDRLQGADTVLNPARLRELSVSLDSERSLIARAFREQQMLHTLAPKAPALAVIDRQVQRLLGSEVMVCHPIDAPGLSGVLVFAVDRHHIELLSARGRLLEALVKRLAARSPESAQVPPASDAPDANRQRLRHLRHEINNPLSTVRNYVHVLRTQLGDDHAAAAHLELIQQEIGRVTQLVDEIPGSECEVRPSTPVALNELLEDWLRMSVESLTGSSRIELDLELDPDLPPIVTDANAVKQILLNLTRNAIEAMDGSGTLTVRTQDFFKIDGTPGIELDIADTGPGLPEAVRTRLFEPVKTTKGAGHSGLGLSIVKKLVDRLDGSISCESSAEGTRFQIVLPRNLPETTRTTRIVGDEP